MSAGGVTGASNTSATSRTTGLRSCVLLCAIMTRTIAKSSYGEVPGA